MCNLISSGQARWELPTAGRRIQTIDLHTEGEPLRVILGGFPALQGASILEYRRHVRQQFDQLRTALMWEPRGHADMYGCIVTPPSRCSTSARRWWDRTRSHWRKGTYGVLHSMVGCQSVGEERSMGTV